MSMTPGNIAELLDGMTTLRVQSTSPELGTAMARIRGLRGQYTRLLSDGVPLYFDHPGGLALVQIEPMDLARVEVVPEGASALFGTNAMAGVVNLLSRPPGTEREREFLFSQSMKGTTDGVLWLSSPPTGSWSHTFLVGGHRQDERDVDDDGWSDLPGYSRGTARTRVNWDNRHGRSVSGTAGTTFEKREGGSEFAHQSLESKGADGTLSGQMSLGRYVLSGVSLLFVQSRTRDFSDGSEYERREEATIEIALHGTASHQIWAVGIAADWFANRTEDPHVAAYVAPRGGIFVHDDVHVASWLSIAGSARLDYVKGASDALRVDDYIFSPRGSALVRGGPWAARFSAGRSYFVPTPLTEETEAAGFARLSIDSPLEVETARSESADLSHTTQSSTVTFTVFHNHVDHPALIDRTTYTLRTEPEPVVTRGAEIAATVRHAPFAVNGSYRVRAGARARRPRGRVDAAS